ncbi:MAG: FtsX-like permease family protein [Flavisolibacter sp.]
MFKNYIKTAFRNLLRYKGFATLNILSLSIGIIGCLVIALFVWDEKKYDRHVPDAQQVYRLYEERNDNGVITKFACVPPVFAPFLQKQYPEVDTTARMMMIGDKYLLEQGDQRGYEGGGRYVDPSFFEIFPVKFLSGHPSAALTTSNSIVLSEALARKYFGNTDIIGKTLYVEKDTMEVKGVFAALPEHFHLEFNYLMPISAVNLPEERMQRWTWHQFYTYVKLKPGADVAGLQDKFQAHMKKEIFPTLTISGSTFLPFLQPLEKLYLGSSDFVYDNAKKGNANYVRGLTIIALFVLVIACFNFINLATARSIRRAKEIGVRKVVGAGRRQLILQFISETILLSVISMLIAVFATMLIVPLLNQFTGKHISFNPFTDPLLALLILGTGIIIGMLAGIYPALVLSGFQPIQVLKGSKAAGKGGGWLRPALVVVQFALSVLLIISTMIVYRQTKYLNNKDLGFQNDQVVYFQLRGDASEKLEAFKTEIKKHPGVQYITSGYGLPGDAFAGETIKLPSKGLDKEFAVNVFIGDHGYIKTLGMELIAGRDFSTDRTTDVTEAFVINETAVREWGFGTPEKAIGQSIHWGEWLPLDSSQTVKMGKVIGVVKDFHYKSLHENITPSIIQIYPQVSATIAAKLNSDQVAGAIAHINKTWTQFTPGYPLDYKFMDDSYAAMYRTEENLSDLLWIFAIMAIIVGCMGLFGLAAFSAEQRTKEIGIRKVLGANLFSILGLLSKNFLVMVLIASAIALPIAWWTMNEWLKDFPYRVAISWWIFGLAIIIALLIAFLTVSFQSLRVATTNPVKSLRTE